MNLAELTTPELIRQMRRLRGEPADLRCESDCKCRGTYAGEDRRAEPRHERKNPR